MACSLQECLRPWVLRVAAMRVTPTFRLALEQGRLSFTSFVGIMSKYVEGRETEEDLRASFDYLDVKKQGYVSASDIQRCAAPSQLPPCCWSRCSGDVHARVGEHLTHGGTECSCGAGRLRSWGWRYRSQKFVK
jgi:hypothetical protein